MVEEDATCLSRDQLRQLEQLSEVDVLPRRHERL